jgi:hypothetical protein
MTPTFSPFDQKWRANAEATSVFPTPVSVPVINIAGQGFSTAICFYLNVGKHLHIDLPISTECRQIIANHGSAGSSHEYPGL